MIIPCISSPYYFETFFLVRGCNIILFAANSTKKGKGELMNCMIEPKISRNYNSGPIIKNLIN